MHSLLLNALVSLAMLAGASSLAARENTPESATAKKFSEIPASKALLDEVRKGGFVLYLRHGKTDNSRADRYPGLDLTDCTTQRVLNEEGRKMAADIGSALRKARLPIGEIRVSPLCRTRDTVALALPGQTAAPDSGLMYTANLTSAEKAPVLARTGELLGTPVSDGSNRLVVAHGPNLMDLIGYFPKEGTLVIFRPLGGEPAPSFRYVASIPPAAWAELLR